jgi:hypothetical protein
MIRRLFFWGIWIMVFSTAFICGLGCTQAKDPESAPGQEKFFFGLTLEGLPQAAGQLHSLEQETGLPVSMVNFFLQWPQDPQQKNFPGHSLEAIHDFGALACVTWEPMYYDRQGGEHMIHAPEILKGEYDEYIQGVAAEVKGFGEPVLIRFAHEMNLKRYHWGSTQEEYGQQSPKRYQEIYRYVAGLFQEQGADNAKFVFCPNAESLPSPKRDPLAQWNQASNYYPGAEYVDVLGMDGYNWGQSRTLEKHGWRSSWQSFEQIFASIYEELKGLAADKPIFVFETAAAHQGGDRQKWVQEAFSTAVQWDLQGLFWFQVDKEMDWRLRAEPGSSYPGQIRREHFSPVPCFSP